MKLKQLAAAALAAASLAPAMAAVAPTSTGDSELFLVVFGTGLPGSPDASYTLDLGVFEKAFLLNPVLDVTLGGSNWAQFTSTIDLSTAKWAILGGDNTGVGAGARNLVTTVQSGQEAAPSTLLTENLTASNAQIDAFLGEVNQTGTHATQTNGDSFNATGGLGYFMKNAGNTLNNQSSFDNSNLFGTSQLSNLIRTANGSVVTEAVLATPASLSKVGDDYKLVTAVPEPGGIALAMTALGMLGFVARRRKEV